MRTIDIIYEALLENNVKCVKYIPPRNHSGFPASRIHITGTDYIITQDDIRCMIGVRGSTKKFTIDIGDPDFFLKLKRYIYGT